jgi:glutathione S-transferase
MTPPRLYYMPRTRSSRVLWLLEEIGAAYDLTEIRGAERRSDEHLLRHPLGRVPALELGDGTTMFESAAICLQLADLNPGAGLIGPIGSAARGLVYQWVVFAVSELEGPVFRWIRELGEGVTDSPARDRFAEAADAIQSVIADRDWLIDDRFSVADVSARASFREPTREACSNRGQDSRPTCSAVRHARRTHGRLRSRIAPAADDSRLYRRDATSFTANEPRCRCPGRGSGRPLPDIMGSA